MKLLIFVCIILVAASQGSLRSIRPLNVLPRVPESRITGGFTATRGQFPYQVALQLDGVGVCGASLISETIVLTAAHCIDKFLVFEVLLGAQNLYNYDEIGRQVIYTRDVLVHPGWDLATLANDIAFARLPQPAVLNQYISLIRIPSRSQQISGESFAGYNATLAGWGIYDFANPGVSPELKYVTGIVNSDVECQNVYSGVYPLVDGQMCFKTVAGSGCSSDSGGGITVHEADGELTLVGLLSAGVGPCDGSLPDLHSRLTYFLDWIETETGVTIRP